MTDVENDSKAAGAQSLLTAGLGAWMRCELCLPEEQTPVLICFVDGDIRLGELRWEKPTHEETFEAFQYWDNPHDEGQEWEWEWEDIIYWASLPKAPNEAVEKPLEGSSKPIFGGHLTHPQPMIVEYSAF